MLGITAEEAAVERSPLSVPLSAESGTSGGISGRGFIRLSCRPWVGGEANRAPHTLSSSRARSRPESRSIRRSSAVPPSNRARSSLRTVWSKPETLRDHERIPIVFCHTRAYAVVHGHRGDPTEVCSALAAAERTHAPTLGGHRSAGPRPRRHCLRGASHGDLALDHRARPRGVRRPRATAGSRAHSPARRRTQTGGGERSCPASGLGGRLSDQLVVITAQEVGAWEAERNRTGATVQWRFPTSDARVKLHRFYPSPSQWLRTSGDANAPRAGTITGERRHASWQHQSRELRHPSVASSTW
jgi:hypothetical protein